MRNMITFKIGDTVKYSSGWLQSVGLVASEFGQVKGIVENIRALPNQRQIVTVQWDNEHIPTKIINTNLIKVKGVSND